MALKTEDDYQDKIDDLIKEIDRLYDEGTDKGFKLKRGEEMEQELRALKTEKDYQNAIDVCKKNILGKEKALLQEQKYLKENQEELSKAKKDIAKYKKQLENDDLSASDYRKIDTLLDEANREFNLAKGQIKIHEDWIKELSYELKKFESNLKAYYKDAADKGFKVRKNEESDFEIRKISILAGLIEERL